MAQVVLSRADVLEGIGFAKTLDKAQLKIAHKHKESAKLIELDSGMVLEFTFEDGSQLQHIIYSIH